MGNSFTYTLHLSEEGDMLAAVATALWIASDRRYALEVLMIGCGEDVLNGQRVAVAARRLPPVLFWINYFAREYCEHVENGRIQEACEAVPAKQSTTVSVVAIVQRTKGSPTRKQCLDLTETVGDCSLSVADCFSEVTAPHEPGRGVPGRGRMTLSMQSENSSAAVHDCIGAVECCRT